jgi:hypothetical protein
VFSRRKHVANCRDAVHGWFRPGGHLSDIFVAINRPVEQNDAFE